MYGKSRQESEVRGTRTQSRISATSTLSLRVDKFGATEGSGRSLLVVKLTITLNEMPHSDLDASEQPTKCAQVAIEQSPAMHF